MNAHTFPVAASVPEDPAITIVRRWEAHHAALPVVPTNLSYLESEKPQRAFDRACHGLLKIERELARTTPTTIAGAAAALRLLQRVGDLDHEASGIVARVVEFLERQPN